VSPGKLEFHPLTRERWGDLARLFGPRGACGGCWCMWWRLEASEFTRGKGERNRRALRRIVGRGPPPGILAYAAGEPVGWCAFGPRGDYPRLARSRVLAPLDGEPVWSITCFFVAKAWRGRGLTRQLVRAAEREAKSRGARVLEAYPVDTSGGALPDPFVYTGLPSTFEKAGFREVARRSRTRPILRKPLRGARSSRPRSSAARR
jgi:GNAT superfamily N-acetyltransferase